MKAVNEFSDSPLPEIIRERLPKSLFSQNVYYFHAIGSSNTYAKELATHGEPEGTMVITEEQTEGKGRLGRQWYSPSRVNLLFSVIYRPPFSIERIFSLSMLTALAIVDGIYDMAGLHTLIKWPNDIYCKDKKVAGILTEFSTEKKKVEYVIVGTGLNVNWDMRGKPELDTLATSLRKELGRPISRVDLLVRILMLLERYYRHLLRGRSKLIFDRWNEFSMVVGKEVLIGSAKEGKRATVTKIDKNGALVIRDRDGGESSVICGDVRVLFPSLPGNTP
jgi:BirA family biotin operon repressor/biotin-[acetyl-CoA-carboxylase] ligase